MNLLVQRSSMWSMVRLWCFSLILLKFGSVVNVVPFASWMIVGIVLIAFGLQFVFSHQDVSEYLRLSLQRRKYMVDMMSPWEEPGADIRAHQLISLVDNQSERAMIFLYFQLYLASVVYPVMASVSLVSCMKGFGFEWIFVAAVFSFGFVGMMVSFLGDVRSFRRLVRIMSN